MPTKNSKYSHSTPRIYFLLTVIYLLIIIKAESVYSLLVFMCQSSCQKLEILMTIRQLQIAYNINQVYQIMTSRISNLGKQSQQKNQLLPSAYYQLLYKLNNFSYRLQTFNFTGFFEHITVTEHENPDKQAYFLLGKKIHALSQCLQELNLLQLHYCISQIKAQIKDSEWIQKRSNFKAQQLLKYNNNSQMSGEGVYRKNFKLTPDINSDFGWGCLLRVGQMMLAQAIRLYFQHRYPNFHNSQIIQSFLELEDSRCPYSIQKLATSAKRLWNKNVGQWYSMMQVLSVVQETHLNNPMQGTKDFQIKIYNQSVDIDELKNQVGTLNQTFTDPPFLNTQFPQKLNFSQQAELQEIDLTKSIFKPTTLQKHRTALLVIVNTKIGDKVVDDASYNKLLKLMELPIFMGCIAGVRGKAIFVTGKHGQCLSYLDPHFVQQAQFTVDQQQPQSFICRDYLLMSKSKLNPEISVCFFLNSGSDLQILIDGIDSIQQQCAQSSKFMSYHFQSQTEDSDKEMVSDGKFSLTHSEQYIQVLEETEEDKVDSEQYVLIQ